MARSSSRSGRSRGDAPRFAGRFIPGAIRGTRTRVSALPSPFRRGYRSAIWFVAALLTEPEAASAQAAPVALDYSVHEGCPSREQFVATLDARTSGAGPRAAIDGRTRWFRVVIARTSTGKSAGSVEFDDEREPRTVGGESCADVADALALMIAIALDRKGDAEPREAPLPTAPPPPPSPPLSPPAPPTTALGRGLALATGVDLGAEIAATPRLALGARLFAEMGATAGGRVVGSRARLSIARLGTGTIDLGSGAASFTITLWRLEACPSMSTQGALGWLRACAFIETGSVDAKGQSSATVTARKARALWLAGGVGARIAWPTQGLLFVELDAGAIFPLVRPTYGFDRSGQPPDIVHATPWAGASGGLGLGLRLP